MPKLTDIAKKSGVSTATVSYVLNNRAEENRISKETQQIVLDAAQSLGYKKSKSRTNITLFGLNSSLELVGNEIFRAINQTFLYESIKFNLSIWPYDANSLKRQSALWNDENIDVSIIYGATKSDLDILNQNHPIMPTILINRALEGYHTVTIDHDKVADLVADYSMETVKKKDILIIQGKDSLYGYSLRSELIMDKLEKKNSQIKKSIIHIGNNIEDGYNLGLQLLLKRKLPGVIVCVYDQVAYGLMSALQENNIKIGEDVNIITTSTGMHNILTYSYSPVTIVNIKIYEAVLSAIRLAQDLVNNKSIEFIKTTLEPDIIHIKNDDYIY